MQTTESVYAQKIAIVEVMSSQTRKRLAHFVDPLT